MTEFNIHPVMAQSLISRGYRKKQDVHQFLYAKLLYLHPPNLLLDIEKAVTRIYAALKAKEKIIVVGDNDVDGMTGTALLVDFLRTLGVKAYYYIPHRSLSRDEILSDASAYAVKQGCTLLITVDCGVTEGSQTKELAEKNIDLIITDHHEPTDKIPHCVATLNPKLLNNNYPNRDLTGVGVAFKLAHGITDHLVNEGKISPKKIDLKRFLDLVALGTISDMGALMGENRILVRYGIRQLRKTKRIGLTKLVSISDVDLNELNTFTVASKIAPRLNSLGRIDDPQKGVEVLLIRNAQVAEKMAEELDLNNIERQKIERSMSAEVGDLMSENPQIFKEKAIIIQSEKWHPGIIAILSTRIAKAYNRPTIVISIDKDVGKGSLRSIPGFPLLGVLKESADLLMNFGGHDFAAGLTIKVQNIEEFKRRFIAAAEARLSENDVMSKLHLDAEVSFEDLTFDLMESIKLLEPFGNENPQPVLYSYAKQAWPPKVVGKTHLKLYLEQGDRVLEGIAFGKAAESPNLRKKDIMLRVAFTPQINNFQGQSIQLMIRDFRIMES